jgi:glycerol-3-phosphate dehydrogenase
LKVDVAVDNHVDLLVVGGGINGAGIARDAAGRGLKVALVEQSDLASATSSAATKLIHGGLRYLEFFEFRLVREALIERELLLAIAPHIIRPLRFVFPHVENLRPRWQIRMGLFLYDHLGGRERLPASSGIRLAGTIQGAPLRDSMRHGFIYSDCWADDSRLVVLNAMDAAERGASIYTRTRFLSASVNGGIWVASCQDGGSGRRFEIRSRAIVNAAGPWVEDVIAQMAGRRDPKGQIRLVKGSHIVVPRLYEGDHAYTLQNPDGRVIFAIPYEQNYTVIGTTDVPFQGDPSAVRISAEEIAYLCESSNRYFRREIAATDVKWSYAGVRPLSDDEAEDVSKVTRDYRLELTVDAGAAVLSIFGGKITTYRKLAAAALSKLRPHIGGAAAEWTAGAPLPGGDLPDGDMTAFLMDVRSRWSFLTDDLALRLCRAYGTRINDVLTDAKRMRDLGRDFGAGLTEAEVEYLRAREWAMTAEDVLWRRTKRGLHMTPEQRTGLQRYLASAPAESRANV